MIVLTQIFQKYLKKEVNIKVTFVGGDFNIDIYLSQMIIRKLLNLLIICLVLVFFKKNIIIIDSKAQQDN